MAKPDQALVKRVLNNFVTGEDVDYFFDSLTSPDWIEPLAAEGLFTSPPTPVPVDGGFQLPLWSAMRYLARMAARSPEQVRKVLHAMNETDNARVRHDYADAVLSLPPEMAVEFVPRLIAWLEDPFQLLLPNQVADLLCLLATNGFPDSAICLAKALFAVRVSAPVRITTDDGQILQWPVEVQPFLAYYHHYELLLQDSLPSFIGGTGIQGFAVLTDLLAQAMKLEASNPEEKRHDYSFLWRPAIEPHSQNNISSTRGTIVTAVRHAAVQLATTHQASLTKVVSHLEGYSWAVFHRIALDVLRVATSKRSSLVSQRLTCTAHLYDSDLHHEFWMLLHDRFADLTPKRQQVLLNSIKTGPPIYWDLNRPYDGDRGIGLKAWQARMLAAIVDHLPLNERAWFDQLVAENRLSEHPEFLSHTDGSFVGATSPLSNEKFTALSDDELLNFLQTWNPKGGWNTPSPEGLGHMIGKAVKEDPGHYANIALTFQSVSPTYINSILEGFLNAAASGLLFAWEPVLQLANRALERGAQLDLTSTQNTQPWSWTRSTVAHLLDVGFNDGRSQIPFELRALSWSILCPLTEDPDPTEESERRFGGNNMDPSTLAINTVRGQAIGSVVKYAVWVHRHLAATRNGLSAIGFKRMPEVREVLNGHLDLVHDPSFAVHSLYGQWFPWLILVDATWATQNVGNIFPADDAQFLYWEAAWEAYVSFCRPYKSALNLLKGEYRRAIVRLAEQSPDRKHPMLSWKSLADHLMLFYLDGRLALKDELLQEFFSNAPVELRSVALRFVGGRSFTITEGATRPIEPPFSGKLVDRAVALWEARIAAAEAADESSAFAAEMAEFGWWFISPAFAPQWTLPQMIRALRVAGWVEAKHLVGPRLADLISAYPEQVLDVIELMMKDQNDNWLGLGDETLIEVLQSALKGSEEVRARSEQIAHELGARGYRKFRSLLVPNKS